MHSRKNREILRRSHQHRSENRRTSLQKIRKNFILDKKNGIGGGVYTWDSKESAEKLYVKGGTWREYIRKAYGAEPEITWFETPFIVDNSKN